jgi:membrane protease YdiL (CAAX protease family)
MLGFTMEQTLLGGFAIAAISAGLACVIALCRRHTTLVLPPQRCRAVIRGAGWCLFAFILFSEPQRYLAKLLEPPDCGKTARLVPALAAGLILFPVQICAYKLIMDFIKATGIPFGLFSRRIFWRDVRLGCALWLLSTPVILGLQLIVRLIALQFTGGKSPENLFIEVLRQRHGDNSMWLLVAAEAVLLAPIREELLFRGCLQSWLTRRPWGGDLGVGLALVTPLLLFGRMMSTATLGFCAAFVAVAAALSFVSWPFLNIASEKWPRVFPRMAHGSFPGQQVYRGVVATALIFAVFHAPSWPDPVPLFALALMLGWLAWRTQSVVASIACHSMFNATSLLILRLFPNSGV